MFIIKKKINELLKRHLKNSINIIKKSCSPIIIWIMKNFKTMLNKTLNLYVLKNMGKNMKGLKKV